MRHQLLGVALDAPGGIVITAHHRGLALDPVAQGSEPLAGPLADGGAHEQRPPAQVTHAEGEGVGAGAQPLVLRR